MKEEMIASAKKARLVESYKRDINEAKNAFGIEDLKYEKSHIQPRLYSLQTSACYAAPARSVFVLRRH